MPSPVAWCLRRCARCAGTETSVADPVPGDPVEIQRRRQVRLRLAEGPIQRFLAGQLAVLDQMAYVASAEPGVGPPAAGVLADSARRRSGMTHVLDQAIEAELAMSRIRALQLSTSARDDRS